MNLFGTWIESATPHLDWLRATLSRRDVLFGLAMAAAVWGAMPAFWEAFTPPDFSRNWRQDCDLVLIHKGLVEHPRFRDTFDWWTGTWVGQVPFWRPLTSLLFWAEWKAFGWQNQDAWMLVHGLLFVISMALIFIAIEALWGSVHIAAGTLLLAAVRGPSLGGWYLWHQTTPGLLLLFWKNTPDLLLAICAFAAIYLAAHGSKGAVVGAAAAAMCKETGFAAFPAIVLADWWRCRQWSWSWLPVAALATGLLAIRMKAIGLGYVAGTNGAVAYRAAAAVLPYPVWAVALKPVRPFAIVGWAVAAAVLLPALYRAPAFAVGIGLAWYACRHITSEFGVHSVAVDMATLFDPRLWAVAAPTVTWLVGAVKGFGVDVMVAAGMSILFTAPCLVAPQVLPHAFFVGRVWGGAAVVLAWRRLLARIVRTDANPNG